MAENQKPKDILLVDDDPDYLELTRTRLEASGYQVQCASNGRQALELLGGERKPQLIILDLDMPDKNGLTTLIDLGVCDSKQPIPVIVATGLQGDRMRDIVMARKVSNYLRKPYEAEELLRTVKGLIG